MTNALTSALVTAMVLCGAVISGVLIIGVLIVVEGNEQILPEEFLECQDDLMDNPSDFNNVNMRFPWLAFLQYLRIKDGQLYHGLVPRVVMIHRQFALATASNAAVLPEGYSLGNIVFSEYDRDESECGVTLQNLREGAECKPAELIMPIEDVVVHPEFMNFGAPDSLALLKMVQPIESQYMTPVCLPYLDVVNQPQGRGPIFLVDFLNKDLLTLNQERKYTVNLHLLPSDVCGRFQGYWNISESWRSRSVCTSGCGMQPGAPLVAHQTNGWWILVGLTSRAVPCPLRGARRTRNPVPPLFVYVWPYVDWIANVILGSGRRSGRRKATDKNRGSPFGGAYFAHLTRLTLQPERRSWVGRVYRVGGACWTTKKKLYHYYKDRFKMSAEYNGDLQFDLNILVEPGLTVACVKVMMPNRFLTPAVYGILYWNLTIHAIGAQYRKTYEIIIDAAAFESLQADKTRWMDEIKDKTDKNKKG